MQTREAGEMPCRISPAFKGQAARSNSFRPPFEVETRVLLGPVARDGRDARDEIEDVLGFAPFLGQHRLDDFAHLGFAETALTQKFAAVVVTGSP